jgi:hypothetical protein
MAGLGFPESTDQFGALFNDKNAGQGLRSDASVEIITSSNLPNKEIYLRDIFPTYLGNLVFETRNTNVNYLSCTVRFSVRDFIINDIVG